MSPLLCHWTVNTKMVDIGYDDHIRPKSIELGEFQFSESRSPEFRLASQFPKPFGRDRERSLLLPWIKTSVSWWWTRKMLQRKSKRFRFTTSTLCISQTLGTPAPNNWNLNFEGFTITIKLRMPAQSWAISPVFRKGCGPRPLIWPNHIKSN